MARQAQGRCPLGQVEEAVRRLVAAATRLDHEVGAEAGLTLSTCEANFVNLLLLHGPLSPSRLGRLSGIGSSGTITGVIDRLERAGYVRRVRSVEDRRKVLVGLDLERIGLASGQRSTRLAEIAREYDDAQLAVIADFLNRVADAEGAAGGAAGGAAEAAVDGAVESAVDGAVDARTGGGPPSIS